MKQDEHSSNQNDETFEEHKSRKQPKNLLRKLWPITFEESKKNTPHRVEVEHRGLQLGQLYGRDANGPDVTELVVATVLLHRRDFWSHPGWIQWKRQR